MGYDIGFDADWNRDIGYGVPAECDHPECKAEIDRGLSYVCGGEIRGGDKGCGLYFCSNHLDMNYQCECCAEGVPNFKPKPDVKEWVEWKLTDASWQRWRDENPEQVKQMREQVSGAEWVEIPDFVREKQKSIF